MSYIRIGRHFLSTPFVVLGSVEFVAVAVASLVTHQLFQTPADQDSFGLHSAAIIAAVLTVCTTAMGVYPALTREGLASMLLRSLVSYCLLGLTALIVLQFLIPPIGIAEEKMFWVISASFMVTALIRWLFSKIIDRDNIKRKVAIFGNGRKAADIIEDYEKEKSNLPFQIQSVIKNAVDENMVNTPVIEEPGNWLKHCEENEITEIVIAPDERRKSGGARFPLTQLLDAKMAGIEVLQPSSFYEREFSKINLDLLQPSWLLFSDGSKSSSYKRFVKRLFDLALAISLTAVLWPFMILTALAVAIESGFPVLYFQTRTGYNGKPFRIYKFRSMRQDAEKDGKAKWASANDSRVTRVGKVIRNLRLDELPQLYNVLVGEMSFVGPRPERPEFVESLKNEIDFYDLRHRVKPGLMGWAQVKYPYGASVEDAKNKLEYDLYYTKNHGLFMDILIVVQTVEIVLLGKGVR